MTETRDTIANAVEVHPGIHFNELVRRLDLAPGQVQYHLKRLRGEDAVLAERIYGRTHYFTPEYDDWERRALALLRRETAGDAVAYLLVHGETRSVELAENLDIARSTLEWHLDRLMAHGLVVKHRDGRRVTVTPEAPEATTRLLREADPLLRERLVDRFSRLVDRFLES
jgi:predicted transcriptional regulator